jgi:hypothetical protein
MPRHKIHPPRHPAGYANFAASRTSGRKNRSQSLSDARDKRSLRLSSPRFSLEKHAFFLLRLCRFTAQSAFVPGVLPARAPLQQVSSKKSAKFIKSARTLQTACVFSQGVVSPQLPFRTPGPPVDSRNDGFPFYGLKSQQIRRFLLQSNLENWKIWEDCTGLRQIL